MCSGIEIRAHLRPPCLRPETPIRPAVRVPPYVGGMLQLSSDEIPSSEQPCAYRRHPLHPQFIFERTKRAGLARSLGPLRQT